MNTRRKAPTGLSKHAAALWDEYMQEYVIDDAHGLHLLTTSMQAYDTMLSALDDVKKKGAVVTNHRGELRANPSTTIARDARAQMLLALRHLNLDLLPRGKPGRPAKGG